MRSMQPLEDKVRQRRADTEVEFGLLALGDPALLYEVMQNLLGNAWKFTAKTLEARIQVGRLASPGDGNQGGTAKLKTAAWRTALPTSCATTVPVLTWPMSKSCLAPSSACVRQPAEQATAA